MKEKLIKNLFEKFEENKESITEQLRNDLDVIVLQAQGIDDENLRMVIHYMGGKINERQLYISGSIWL